MSSERTCCNVVTENKYKNRMCQNEKVKGMGDNYRLGIDLAMKMMAGKHLFFPWRNILEHLSTLLDVSVLHINVLHVCSF